MMDGIRNSPVTPFTTRAAGSREAAADPAQPVRRAAGIGATASSASSVGAALVADLAKAPPVDAARVAALKAAIDAGSYRVDPDAIAAAMLRLDQGRP
jgi:negative regulator of flagellin synthesis FlgM